MVDYPELETVFSAMNVLFGKDACVYKRVVRKGYGAKKCSARINVPNTHEGKHVVVVVFEGLPNVYDVNKVKEEVTKATVSGYDRVVSEEVLQEKLLEKMKAEAGLK